VSSEPDERRAGGVVAAIAPAGARARHASIEGRRRLVSESLQIGNPSNRARDLPEQADPRHDCQIEVKVEDIRPYEHNPRRANNAKFAEIKESIRATGIRNPLTVTRRPGEKHFVIEAGGNTRLLAVQQLWAETRDPRLEKLTVLFRPWRSDAHVLVAHLIENEQRGELTFWDKANGLVALKAQFEEEKGRTLSLRQLEEELKAAGFPVNMPTLVRYLYATARLRVLGEAIPVLSGLHVKTIQLRLNLLKRYAEARGATGEQSLYEAAFEPVFQKYADRYREIAEFDASELCLACEEAFAQHLGEDLVRLRMVLDTLAQAPQMSRESLAHIVDSMESDLRAASTTAVGRPPEDASGASSASTPCVATAPQGLPPINGQTRRQTKLDEAALDQLKVRISRFRRLAAEPFVGRAWSLLAPVSTQLDERVRQLLHEASSSKGGCPPTLMTLDAEFFDWLLDGRNEAATTFWEIATFIRKLRGAAPASQAESERSRSAGSQ